MQSSNTSIQYSEHFARIARAVFAGETWDACADSLFRSWNQLYPELSWQQALPNIRAAWDEANEEPRVMGLDRPLWTSTTTMRARRD